jgi:hypothetical protein
VKTKTRNSLITLSHNDHRWLDANGAVLAEYLPYIADYDYYSSKEEIQYECSNKTRFNFCEHTKFTSFIPCNEVHDFFSGSDHVYYNGLVYALLVAVNGFVRYDVDPDPVDIDWDVLSNKAWEAMRPQIVSDVNIVTFIHELKDLKKLPDLWQKEDRNLLHNITNLHLNVSFGWLPFLSDIWQLYKNLFNLKKRIQTFLDNAGKPQRRHFTYSWKPDPTPVNIIDVSTGGSSRVINITTTRSQMKYCATMSYVYSTGEASQLVKTIGGYLDALGINLDPQILWDSIPFSFIVDWFFNVGAWLGSLKVENTPAITYITEFGHSVKYQVTREAEFVIGTGTHIAYHSTWDKYRRHRSLPATTPGLHYSGPGLSQILLAGSLTAGPGHGSGRRH